MYDTLAHRFFFMRERRGEAEYMRRNKIQHLQPKGTN